MELRLVCLFYVHFTQLWVILYTFPGLSCHLLQFGQSVASISQSTMGQPAMVKLADGREIAASLVVGADGVRSAVADHLQIPKPNYAGYLAYRLVNLYNSQYTESSYNSTLT